MRIGMVMVVGGALLAGALVAAALLPGVQQGPGSFSTGQALVGGPFTLTDHTGKRVTQKDFLGRKMLVYFGFTQCPDICPGTLQVMAAALDKLGPKAATLTPVFMTVDPERDTPQVLAEYVKSFDPRIVGLTGTPQEIEAAAKKAFRVYYKKVASEGSAASYTVDHMSIMYLMDEHGRFVKHFPHPTDPDKLAEALAKLL